MLRLLVFPTLTPTKLALHVRVKLTLSTTKLGSVPNVLHASFSFQGPGINWGLTTPLLMSDPCTLTFSAKNIINSVNQKWFNIIKICCKTISKYNNYSYKQQLLQNIIKFMYNCFKSNFKKTGQSTVPWANLHSSRIVYRTSLSCVVTWRQRLLICCLLWGSVVGLTDSIRPTTLFF